MFGCVSNSTMKIRIPTCIHDQFSQLNRMSLTLTDNGLVNYLKQLRLDGAPAALDVGHVGRGDLDDDGHLVGDAGLVASSCREDG